MSRLAAELPRVGVILFMVFLADGRLMRRRQHYRVPGAVESNGSAGRARNPALSKAREAPGEYPQISEDVRPEADIGCRVSALHELCCWHHGLPGPWVR